ncbi:IclR family transcriptional regulator [Neptunomonas phycophila]|uniref:HTH-type transcriptional repressor AllR n=1 Tax=Neptunomonas phycophila TaxID=1572645 RepID=A0ABT9EUQ4_9GAMM|nr:IclR family transcriptional regulator [Neptunomonas phycophila]MDP2522655.1 IclR family transcriptional regulator [Neptunomonas phycophila]
MTSQRSGRGPSVTRVMEIVETVSTAEQPMSPTDISFYLGIPKASLHRLIQQLEADGYLQMNMRGKVVPGERMYKVALGVIHSSRYKIQRQAILQRLGRELDEACGIAIPDRTEMIYYDRVESSWPLQFNLKTGSRVPLWCTSSGKLYLSFLPKNMRHRVINSLSLDKFSRATLTDPDSLEESLITIRENEMGIDNEEYMDGMVGCSVPIKNSEGNFVASLYTHVPVIRKSLKDLLKFEPQLRQAALDISDLINSPVIETGE